MHGPGKYDEICTAARQMAGPFSEAVLIIRNGFAGHGFSVQATGETIMHLPNILREMADQIENDLRTQLN